MGDYHKDKSSHISISLDGDGQPEMHYRLEDLPSKPKAGNWYEMSYLVYCTSVDEAARFKTAGPPTKLAGVKAPKVPDRTDEAIAALATGLKPEGPSSRTKDAVDSIQRGVAEGR